MLHSTKRDGQVAELSAKIRFLAFATCYLASGCSSSSDGGSLAPAGGAFAGSTGGAYAIGGLPSSIGGAIMTTGGRIAAGGATGGAISSGGVPSPGGMQSTGGAQNVGGTQSPGGATTSAGGTKSVGGSQGTGGATTNTGGSAVTGCTGSLTGEDPSVYTARKPSTSNRYQPLSVGAHWGWQESNSSTGASGQRQSWVEALEQLAGTKAGVSAYRVRSTTLTGGTLNWQQDTGTTLVRHRSQFFDLAGLLTSSDEMVPSQMRLDETAGHLVVGTTWTETYADTKTRSSGAVVTATLNVTWTVEAIDEIVTVPAGTFSCLRVHRVELPSSIDSTGGDNVYWFARGVGKVKETGPVYHELVGYCYP